MSADTIMMPQDLVDRLLIREVLEKYLAALDRKDWEEIASCFTDDAISHYNNDPNTDLKGGLGVANFLHGMLEYNATSHGLSHARIHVDGDRAHAHSVVIATMHKGEHGIGRVRVRAIDYQDDLVKTEGGWLIVRRTHGPTLQYDALSQTMVLFSQQGS